MECMNLQTTSTPYTHYGFKSNFTHQVSFETMLQRIYQLWLSLLIQWKMMNAATTVFADTSCKKSVMKIVCKIALKTYKSSPYRYIADLIEIDPQRSDSLNTQEQNVYKNLQQVLDVLHLQLSDCWDLLLPLGYRALCLEGTFGTQLHDHQKLAKINTIRFGVSLV